MLVEGLSKKVKGWNEKNSKRGRRMPKIDCDGRSYLGYERFTPKGGYDKK